MLIFCFILILSVMFLNKIKYTEIERNEETECSNCKLETFLFQQYNLMVYISIQKFVDFSNHYFKLFELLQFWIKAVV